MAQLSDDCFAFGGDLMPLDDALALLRTRVRCVAATERVGLADAPGRVLAEAAVGVRAVPPTDNSAVDGYAVRFADLAASGPTTLPVGGSAAAGRPLGRPAGAGEAIRIFTGAPMPDGADTVLMQEDCTVADGRVTIPHGIRAGANRRFAGEDVTVGAPLLAAGSRLRPQDVAVLASQGATGVAVRRPLRVALMSTGDEVHEPGTTAPAGAIYDSNRCLIAGLLRRLGCAVDDRGIVPDRREAVREALADAAAAHDLVVTSGGMSTGDHDHLPAVLRTAGRLDVWRLSIKPGRPVGLGLMPGADGMTPVLGLPGNPVAAMVTFLFLGRALVDRLAGAVDHVPHRFPVRLGFAARKKANRREFVRATLDPAGADGVPVARRFPRDGAGVLMSMVAADGLVELAEGVSGLDAGAVAPFIPMSEVMP
ncbi:MAG: molybdopterin molybdotransferase MoeA [Alphaproteobacteria bacterium]